ncbi:ATP-binding cassette domain-containing protein [Rudaeicoccus suwonensis]|uniref:Monosaccharide ABC transporter ATP-binding protein (CUT2 family) n=1 Tax=Rudaeicoccus suwonensis TaxID=657409 RepID=A0A561E0X9_9MICO|nr:ATP-binding cassette domain-containing protein [Rudaeicoccus suwonensis]TWE09298.1 monosaccharide ABC transporter ATP-binding protein (CUT2 family) [Rudaeicoccus suwonensis]
METIAEKQGSKTTDVLLDAQHLTKSFDAVQALRDASIRLERGRVTALLGDNGAGKSTLVRCLTGVHPADSGTITIDGVEVHFSSPDESRRSGIETVYQTLSLIDDLPVWQNLFLRRELTKGVGPFQVLDKREMRDQATAILTELDVHIPSVTTTVRRMSGGQRQSIAIARAAHWGRQLVVMDEPTAALGVRETAAVEALVARLRDRGITVLLISHDMAQVKRIADTAVVMRRGTTVARRAVSDVSSDDLVGLITGAQPGDAGA